MLLRSGTARYFTYFCSGDWFTRPKMGYALHCVEDKNETSGDGMGYQRRTGLHP